MAYSLDIKTCFLRMGNDSIENANPMNINNNYRKVLHYAMECLEYTKPVEGFGDAVAYTTRPWVLLFCSSRKPIETAISHIFIENKGDGPNKRILLQDIRLCYVKNIHELRAILASIHLSPNSETKTDIISWIHQEKQGQPPSFVCVMDLLELLLGSDGTFDPDIPSNDRHLYIRFDQLANILALLTETCSYLDNQAKIWEQPFGHSTRLTTLLVTDNGCLLSLPEGQQKGKLSQPNNNGKVLETLYQIIVYYLGNIV
ncbi:uncharacterized protein BX664DRAFT_312384 [Halteromyces radiatus]|uniref:uncharacterized protein n=1 Tax=Halteromyces radiatus TaxID=101107 RepID=UPI00221FA22E|nr:uncharacterized protein BX664DRAFT_312384 [Halteromyces radiatus]KAI8097552.1 hypothetical protein BX664DRAFT_312384 [Halteromyces radiatus]